MNKVKASLGMLAVTAAAAAGLAIWGAAQREAPALPVQTCRVALGSVEQVLALNGVLRYETEYAAISPETGVVADVYVQPGNRVKAGQALFRLDESAAQSAVSAAVAGWSALPDMGAELLEATLRQAAAQLECLTVRAPADALVQQVQVSPHAGILAGTAAVLLSGEGQVIQCSAVLKDAERLHPGLQARIIKDGVCLTMAAVGSIGPAQASGSTGQTLCQVTLTPEQPIALPLGAGLEAEIILQAQSRVPVVPVQALTERDTLWWVAEGRCYEMPARVLLADEVNCWVPLPEGTEIICSGETPVEGQRVKVMGQ